MLITLTGYIPHSRFCFHQSTCVPWPSCLPLQARVPPQKLSLWNYPLCYWSPLDVNSDLATGRRGGHISCRSHHYLTSLFSNISHSAHQAIIPAAIFIMTLIVMVPIRQQAAGIKLQNVTYEMADRIHTNLHCSWVKTLLRDKTRTRAHLDPNLVWVLSRAQKRLPLVLPSEALASTSRFRSVAPDNLIWWRLELYFWMELHEENISIMHMGK